tara:strand:- start:9027 stop:9344 length:318 start_codon:yes stop_codon:yes gene_type:complete
MQTIEISDNFELESSEESIKQGVKNKIIEASKKVRNLSLESIHEVLEDLSDEIRSAISMSSIDCYDTLVEIDSLCFEAEVRSNFNYEKELKDLAVFYEQEVLDDN